MDQVKIGKFIAELRKREGFTQEVLGEKIGVTNKTISRWENGNYMPDIEMFQILGEVFHVSINELLTGQFLSDEDFKKESDKNIVDISKESVFSCKEKLLFWKRKWLNEHIALIVLLSVLYITICIYSYIIKLDIMILILPIAGLAVYIWLRNKMAAYAEYKTYINK